MIDFEKEDRSEPPWTRDFSDEDIRQIIDEPLVVPVLHHTQYVERAIRVITQLGGSLTSDEKRKGMALATFKDCEERPRCETKADFMSATYVAHLDSLLFCTSLCTALIRNHILSALCFLQLLEIKKKLGIHLQHPANEI
jgi:hypothetical protein